MKISGIQKLSLVDFDGYVACTIFTSGCNFACPFCHNSRLVNNTEPDIKEKEILEYLTKRKNMIDAVCISGGEPTLHHDLKDFIIKIKQLGYKVKLDSNGTNPEMIKDLYESKLIDYIAMDIKNSYEKYSITIGKEYELENIKKSINYIMSCGIDYEFRTTLVESLHEKDDMKAIGKMIKSAKKYYLQKFEDSGECIQSGLKEINKQLATEYLEIVKKYIPTAKLRGY